MVLSGWNGGDRRSSHPDYKNRRLLVVQPMVMEGEKADEEFLAIDNSHAGIGDTVLVNREGNGARQVLNNPDACVISVIVGIVGSNVRFSRALKPCSPIHSFPANGGE